MLQQPSSSSSPGKSPLLNNTNNNNNIVHDQPFLEHEATRKSLQSAFSSIFERFDREFSSDDELDLGLMAVVKMGKHLAAAPKRIKFGTIFKKDNSNNSRQQGGKMIGFDLEDEDDEDERNQSGVEDQLQGFFTSFRKHFTESASLKKANFVNASDDTVEGRFDDLLFEMIKEYHPRDALKLCKSIGPDTAFDSALLTILEG